MTNQPTKLVAILESMIAAEVARQLAERDAVQAAVKPAMPPQPEPREAWRDWPVWHFTKDMVTRTEPHSVYLVDDRAGGGDHSVIGDKVYIRAPDRATAQQLATTIGIMISERPFASIVTNYYRLWLSGQIVQDAARAVVEAWSDGKSSSDQYDRLIQRLREVLQ